MVDGNEVSVASCKVNKWSKDWVYESQKER